MIKVLDIARSKVLQKYCYNLEVELYVTFVIVDDIPNIAQVAPMHIDFWSMCPWHVTRHMPAWCRHSIANVMLVRNKNLIF